MKLAAAASDRANRCPPASGRSAAHDARSIRKSQRLPSKTAKSFILSWADARIPSHCEREANGNNHSVENAAWQAPTSQLNHL